MSASECLSAFARAKETCIAFSMQHASALTLTSHCKGRGAFRRALHHHQYHERERGCVTSCRCPLSVALSCPESLARPLFGRANYETIASLFVPLRPGRVDQKRAAEFGQSMGMREMDDDQWGDSFLLLLQSTPVCLLVECWRVLFQVQVAWN